MAAIRVFVVDDSAFMRKLVSNRIESDNRIKVVDTASDGKTALNKLPNLSSSMSEEQIEADLTGHNQTIHAIGTSIGSPRALAKVLSGLPDHFPAPILIVQHIPAQFTKSLAERLDRVIRLHVKEVVQGEVIKSQTVYIASGGFHMLVNQAGESFTIKLSQEEPILGHRPSVDVLFQSLAQQRRINKIAVILTGMGKDGTKGIRQLKQSNPNTIIIAESPASAIVYGMPKSAVQTDQVDLVSHLDQMSEMITRILS